MYKYMLALLCLGLQAIKIPSDEPFLGKSLLDEGYDRGYLKGCCENKIVLGYFEGNTHTLITKDSATGELSIYARQEHEGEWMAIKPNECVAQRLKDGIDKIDKPDLMLPGASDGDFAYFVLYSASRNKILALHQEYNNENQVVTKVVKDCSTGHFSAHAYYTKIVYPEQISYPELNTALVEALKDKIAEYEAEVFVK